MIIKGLTPSRMTPAERAKGRFMRAPDGHGDGDEGLDNDTDEDDDDDQSGDADDDTDDTGDDNDSNDEDADNDDKGSRQDARGKSAPKNGYERRIAKLTRQVAELSRGKQSGQDDASGRAAEPPAKPKVTDFDTYEDFAEALAEFKAKGMIEEALAARDKRNATQRADDEFQRTFSQGKRAYKDFDDVVTEDVEITPTAIAAIRTCDNPADVAYYLGSNPNEAERIHSLPLHKQANAIAKIDARFDGKRKESNGKTTLREVSSAPEPIRPNKGAGGSVKKDMDKMSADEFIRARNAELRQKKG